MVHLGPKKPQARKGSMADVPKELMDEIHQLEDMFTVDSETLRKVVKHFIDELNKGLTKKGGNILELVYSNLPPFLWIKAFLSLSKCNLVITSLDGCKLIGTEAPLTFSLVTLST